MEYLTKKIMCFTSRILNKFILTNLVIKLITIVTCILRSYKICANKIYVLGGQVKLSHTNVRASRHRWPSVPLPMGEGRKMNGWGEWASLGWTSRQQPGSLSTVENPLKSWEPLNTGGRSVSVSLQDSVVPDTTWYYLCINSLGSSFNTVRFFRYYTLFFITYQVRLRSLPDDLDLFKLPKLFLP